MDELRFDDRVAVVTGAGGNPSLGRAFAMLLASRGASVVVNDIGGDPESKGYVGVASAEAVAQEIVDAGGTAIPDTNSVATEASAAALVTTAMDAFGRVDILVNCAGISLSADFDELSSRDFVRTIDINLMGTVWTTRAAWRHMKAAGYGRIVNVTSAAFAGLGRLSAYAASKGGVLALTRGLAVDGEEFGIKANSLAPAAYTRMIESQQEPDSLLLKMAKESQPAEEVAPVVGLLSHESCPVSGECISAVAGFVNRIALAQTPGWVYDPPLTMERLVENWTVATDDANAMPLPPGFIDVKQWSPKPYQP